MQKKEKCRKYAENMHNMQKLYTFLKNVQKICRRPNQYAGYE